MIERRNLVAAVVALSCLGTASDGGPRAALELVGKRLGALLMCEQMGYGINKAGAKNYLLDEVDAAEARGLQWDEALAIVTDASDAERSRVSERHAKLLESVTANAPDRLDQIASFVGEEVRICAGIADDPSAARAFNRLPESHEKAGLALAAKYGLIAPEAK